jgi:hypothetical protein
MLICETGMFDMVLQQEIDATCKVCGDKFYFKSANPVTPPPEAQKREKLNELD